MHLSRFRPSPALVVACVALIVALGGTTYAAIKLPPNSVDNRALRRNAVTASKIKNGTVGTSDLAPGVLRRGPAGPPGPRGRQGERGPAGDAPQIAYAEIGTGEVGGHAGVSHAHGITADMVRQESPSLYCFSGLPFTPRNVQVTTTTGATTIGYAQAQIDTSPDPEEDATDFCLGKAQAEIYVFRGAPPDEYSDDSPHSFYVTFFG
jgi:hypothetical protein